MTPALDLEDRPGALGHHFVIGLQATPDLSDHDKRLLEDMAPAGVTLFAGNFDQEAPYEEWLARYERLLASVRECIQRRELLVSIDHEGGAVHRLPGPITHFPGAPRWRHRAREVGRAMGVELGSLGINVNFAPVMDVLSNPDSPAIRGRAFSSDPAGVIAAGLAFVDGLEQQGVLACVKHFPGHGAASLDSHLALPVIADGLDVLRSRDLLPFAAAVEAGVRLVMTSHLAFPAICSEISTLSPTLIGNILRQEIGFSGVVITDDLGMRAVSDLFLNEDSVVDTIRAGTDIILLSDHWTDNARIRDFEAALRKGLRSGRLDRDWLDLSSERIWSLLRAARRAAVRPLESGELDQHATLAGSFEEPAG